MIPSKTNQNAGNALKIKKKTRQFFGISAFINLSLKYESQNAGRAKNNRKPNNYGIFHYSLNVRICRISIFNDVTQAKKYCRKIMKINKIT